MAKCNIHAALFCSGSISPVSRLSSTPSPRAAATRDADRSTGGDHMHFLLINSSVFLWVS